MAYNIEEEGLIASIIDAKNENVYFSLFSHFNDKYEKKEDFRADNIYNVIDTLLKYNNEKITFVGDGSEIYHNIILEKIKNANFASSKQNLQTSISIGVSAFDKYKKGLCGDSGTLIPLYLRKSQAERALERRKVKLVTTTLANIY